MTIDSIGKSIRNSRSYFKPLKILSISSNGLSTEGVSDTPTISTGVSTSKSSKSEIFSEGSVCSVSSFSSESIFSPPTSSKSKLGDCETSGDHSTTSSPTSE